MLVSTLLVDYVSNGLCTRADQHCVLVGTLEMAFLTRLSKVGADVARLTDWKEWHSNGWPLRRRGPAAVRRAATAGGQYAEGRGSMTAAVSESQLEVGSTEVSTFRIRQWDKHLPSLGPVWGTMFTCQRTMVGKEKKSSLQARDLDRAHKKKAKVHARLGSWPTSWKSARSLGSLPYLVEQGIRTPGRQSRAEPTRHATTPAAGHINGRPGQACSATPPSLNSVVERAAAEPRQVRQGVGVVHR